MPGEAWPWMKTWSPEPPSQSLPRKKWLKPTSYRLAALAYVAMCPPTPISGRLARLTVMAAFQRTYARMRRSRCSSPGNQGSRSGGIVLMKSVLRSAGTPTAFSRARSSR